MQSQNPQESKPGRNNPVIAEKSTSGNQSGSSADDHRERGRMAWPRRVLGNPWEQEELNRNLFAWKCAMLLLGQNLWIQRRVENVSFTAQGTTRRQMSFDFVLPKDKTIYWRDPESSERLVAVPLTFLGKGDLIHADVCDVSGNSLPIVRYNDNKEFTARALDYCLRQLEGADRIEADIWDDCRKSYADLPPEIKPFTVRNSHDGIACMSVEDSDSIQWVKRHVAIWLRMLYGEEVPISENQPIDPYSNPLLQKNQTDWQKNINRCIVALMDCIDRYVRAHLNDDHSIVTTHEQGKAEHVPDFPSWRVRLETYLLLLSTCCDMYACVILLPADYVSSRAIVKLSFDSSYQESLWDRYACPNSEQLCMSFQTSSAQSTHIEINPIEGSRIASVEWDLKGDRQRRVRSSVAAGRIHISTNSERNIPLMRLHMTLLNGLPSIGANMCWSLLFSICAIINTCFILGQFPVGKEYYDASNVFDGLALFLTLWVARRINAINHSLSQDLNRYPSILISANLVTASLSCLFCGLSGSGNAQKTLQWLVVSCCVISLVLTGVIAHGLLVWIRFRLGVSSVYLKEDENESQGDLTDKIKNETKDKAISFLTDNGTVPLPQFNGDYITQSKHHKRRFSNSRQKDDDSHNASLYPADHGPYSIVEKLRSDHRLSAMKNKLFFTARRWDRD